MVDGSGALSVARRSHFMAHCCLAREKWRFLPPCQSACMSTAVRSYLWLLAASTDAGYAQGGCVIRFVRVEFHHSASKHGVETDDVQHAVANAFVDADMGDDESPLRTLVPGPGRSGNMLEIVVLHFDDGREIVIHATPMRVHYRGLLPRPPET